MTKFSANLGFLWPELSLVDGIHAAKDAGFAAVECHWPYDVDAADVRSALEQTGLPMLGLNTQRGDVAQGDNGMAAVTGKEALARQYIDQACEYALAINCKCVHVMAGFTDGGVDAERTFRENLKYACAVAAKNNQIILIEPLNSRDAPGYHLSSADAAIASIEAVGCCNIKLMFDCYHLQIMQGDITRRLQNCLPYIGHIQIAAVPDRSEPDQGELCYPAVIGALAEMGYSGCVGAEYKPRAGTDAGLGWMDAYQN